MPQCGSRNNRITRPQPMTQRLGLHQAHCPFGNLSGNRQSNCMAHFKGLHHRFLLCTIAETLQQFHP